MIKSKCNRGMQAEACSGLKTSIPCSPTGQAEACQAKPGQEGEGLGMPGQVGAGLGIPGQVGAGLGKLG